jgi:hypothetical protein
VATSKVNTWNVTPSVIRSFDVGDKNSTTGYESDSENSSVLSFDTTMTDHTFTLSHLGDLSDSEAESFCTGMSHADSLAEELEVLRETTPFLEMSSYFHKADKSSNSTDVGRFNLTIFFIVFTTNVQGVGTIV